jgi:hypothetical protein
MESTKKRKIKYELEFLFCVGRFGNVKVMLSLTILATRILCISSIRLHTGSKSGPYCSQRTSGSLWLLGSGFLQPGWRLSRTLTDALPSCFAHFLMIDICINLMSFLRCKLFDTYTCNKTAVYHLMHRSWGFMPHLEKKSWGES